jgi:hypothetical protein
MGAQGFALLLAADVVADGSLAFHPGGWAGLGGALADDGVGGL